MQWGAMQDKADELSAAGKSLPQQFQEIPEQPVVYEYLNPVWDEFFDLSTERAAGMAPGPIPSSAIRRRIAEKEINDEDASDRFFNLIRKMDNAYLEELIPKDKSLVATDDVVGTKQMLGRLNRKKNQQRQKKPL